MTCWFFLKIPVYLRTLVGYCLLFTLLVCSAALAQTAPDAGMLRQQIERTLPPLMSRPSQSERPAPPPSMKPLPGDLTVREFRFAGNTLIKAEILQSAVADWLNRPISFIQLQEATAAVASVYRDAGWIVRAYLPRQEIIHDMVTIQIIEATFGRVYFESADVRRIRLARLQMGLENTQSPGQPLNARALDRSLLLLSDLPGVNVAGSLREGARHGESDVVLKVSDAPMLVGDASVDNTGSRSTGTARLASNLVLNSPFEFADQGNLNILHSEGSDYVRLAYSIPLGYNGWRMGINRSQMRYKLIGPNFVALNGFGDSGTLGMDLNYPIHRSRFSNLYFNATLDQKTFDNAFGGSTATRYQVNAVSVAVSGNLTDQRDTRGNCSASLTITSGNVNLDDSPNRAADYATTQTAGNFTKLRYTASRQQSITERLAFSGNVAGQVASKNLDSSEKFYLGGSGGVRAYPASEGGGSEGMLVNLELRWRLVDGFNLTGFYDWGTVKVNRNNDFTGSANQNQFNLSGGGLALEWRGKAATNLKLIWARRSGDNPTPTVTGDDQDGTLIRNRFWLTAAMPF